MSYIKSEQSSDLHC